MSRRAVPIVIAVALMLLAVVASSSGTVSLWESPPADRDRSVDPIEAVEEEEQAPPPDPEEETEDPIDHWLVQAIALVVLAGFFMVVLAVIANWWPSTWTVRRRRRSSEMGEPLPEVDEALVSVDGVAARLALAEGTPRNAIVACWMQLERDAAAAGLARHESETSVEYVERVVEASSVDPDPIRALSALFREARFSEHALDEGHRQRAVEALGRVEGALRIRDEASA
jgi:hypothetical protein